MKKIAIVLFLAAALLVISAITVFADQDGRDCWCNVDNYGCWVMDEEGGKCYINFWTEEARKLFMGDSTAPYTDVVAMYTDGGKMPLELPKGQKVVVVTTTPISDTTTTEEGEEAPAEQPSEEKPAADQESSDQSGEQGTSDQSGESTVRTDLTRDEVQALSEEEYIAYFNAVHPNGIKYVQGMFVYCSDVNGADTTNLPSGTVTLESMANSLAEGAEIYIPLVWQDYSGSNGVAGYLNRSSVDAPTYIDVTLAPSSEYYGKHSWTDCKPSFVSVSSGDMNKVQSMVTGTVSEIPSHFTNNEGKEVNGFDLSGNLFPNPAQ